MKKLPYGCALMHNGHMKTLPEWTDLRFFLELARAGTLSGASRRLDVESPRVAGRIDRPEKEPGPPLFDRHPEGLELTRAGPAQPAHGGTTGGGGRGLVGNPSENPGDPWGVGAPERAGRAGVRKVTNGSRTRGDIVSRLCNPATA